MNKSWHEAKNILTVTTSKFDTNLWIYTLNSICTRLTKMTSHGVCLCPQAVSSCYPSVLVQSYGFHHLANCKTFFLWSSKFSLIIFLQRRGSRSIMPPTTSCEENKWSIILKYRCKANIKPQSHYNAGLQEQLSCTVNCDYFDAVKVLKLQQLKYKWRFKKKKGNSMMMHELHQAECTKLTLPK